jgi:hypothetical protein
MTSGDIQRYLIGWGSALWEPNKVVAARNSVGVAGWEADLLVLQPSGWLWEIEIKVSVADFRRELRSKLGKHKALTTGFTPRKYGIGPRSVIRKFFFALPIAVFEKVKEEIPNWAGVIVIDAERVDNWGRVKPYIAKQAKLLNAEKAPADTRSKMIEAVYYQYWKLKG